MTRRLLGPVAAVSLLALTSCGLNLEEASDSGEGDSPSSSSAPAEPESSDPTEGESSDASEPVESVSESPEPEVRQASCTLKGKSTPKVTLAETEEGMRLTFDGQSVPAQGSALFSATVFDESGEVGVQLGVSYLDGVQDGYFVFDFGTSQQANLGGEALVARDKVIGMFPADQLGELADAGAASWSAAFSSRGRDVGTCPRGMNYLSFPR